MTNGSKSRLLRRITERHAHQQYIEALAASMPGDRFLPTTWSQEFHTGDVDGFTVVNDLSRRIGLDAIPDLEITTVASEDFNRIMVTVTGPELYDIIVGGLFTLIEATVSRKQIEPVA